MGCAPIPPLPPAGCWLVIIGIALVAFVFLTPIVSWIAGG